MPYRIVNSVTGEAFKTFSEHTNEKLNANKNYRALRTLILHLTDMQLIQIDPGSLSTAGERRFLR